MLDATNLSRSLYFLAMVLELGKPTVVALTMNDLARKQGAGIDPKELSHTLGGVPVIEVNGRSGEGKRELMDMVGTHFSGTPLPADSPPSTLMTSTCHNGWRAMPTHDSTGPHTCFHSSICRHATA